jgi:hypothetical protein
VSVGGFGGRRVHENCMEQETARKQHTVTASFSGGGRTRLRPLGFGNKGRSTGVQQSSVELSAEIIASRAALVAGRALQ